MYQKYGYLNLFLAIVHYTFSSIVAASENKDTFRVPLIYSFNDWIPNATDSSGTCSDGCQISEERYSLGDINVTLMIAFFGFISGTNHLVQALAVYFGKIEEWFDNGYVTMIRNADYAVSAALMLLTVLILFLAPSEVMTMLFAFMFQALCQTGGYAAEVLRNLELKDGKPAAESKIVFWTTAAFYTVPWALLFALFFASGYGDLETTRILGPLNNTETPNSEPPLQVSFFLLWLFLTFSTFPICLWWKLNDTNPNQWNYRYEIWFGILSAISKLPLQSFFAFGAFNRQRIAPVGTAIDPAVLDDADAFTEKVIRLAAIPAVVSIVVGVAILYAFKDELHLKCNRAIGGTAGFMLLLVAAFLVPSYVTMAGGDPLLAVEILPLGSFAIVIVAAAIEKFGGSGEYKKVDRSTSLW